MDRPLSAPASLGRHWHRVRAACARRFKRPRAADLLTLALLATLTLAAAIVALALMSTLADAAPLSAGDRIQLTVEAGEEFSGKFQIDVQGRVQLPWAGPVALAGLELDAAARAVSEHLVAVRRGGLTQLHDLRGLLSGEPGDDPALLNGDEVLVAQGDSAQPMLARPSAITPPGIKIFVSNLIQPASGNASASIPGGAVSLAYGARLSQAVVAANCVGGVAGTGAARNAVLQRTDRLSGRTQTWDRPVEALLRNSDESGNPLLLEGDAVSCYDTGVTTVRDVFRTLTDILTPFYLRRSR